MEGEEEQVEYRPPRFKSDVGEERHTTVVFLWFLVAFAGLVVLALMYARFGCPCCAFCRTPRYSREELGEIRCRHRLERKNKEVSKLKRNIDKAKARQQVIQSNSEILSQAKQAIWRSIVDQDQMNEMEDSPNRLHAVSPRDVDGVYDEDSGVHIYGEAWYRPTVPGAAPVRDILSTSRSGRPSSHV